MDASYRGANHINGCQCEECHVMRMRTATCTYGQPVQFSEEIHTCFVSDDPCIGCAKEMASKRERLRAATCKCGHVGAECFNDSYCTPDPKVNTCNKPSVKQCEIADLWRVACQKREREFTKLEIESHDKIDSLQETIDELSHTCDAWRDNYAALEDSMIREGLEQEDRIGELETTIRVLAGLLHG